MFFFYIFYLQPILKLVLSDENERFYKDNQFRHGKINLYHEEMICVTGKPQSRQPKQLES